MGRLPKSHTSTDRKKRFFRVWIVQEVLLAHSALCFRGRHSRPWNDISLAAQWLNHRTFWRFIGDDNPGVGIDKASRIWRFTHVKPHLTNLLSMNLYLQAKEPLDKVYGILGLVESLGLDGGADLVPDYEADLGEVYARATRAAFRANGLSLMNCAQQLVPYDDGKGRDLEVPSWVPRYDWRDYRPGGSPAIPELPLKIGACGARPLEMADGVDSKILRHRGVVLDKITQVGNVLDEDLILNADKLTHEIMKLRTIARSFDHDDWNLAYTLTSNLTHGQAPADSAPHFLNQYRQFLSECRAKVDQTCDADLLHDSSSLTYFTPTAWAYANTVWTHARNRRFFVTKKGYTGTGYPGVEVGDVVCVLFGAWYPFALRPMGGERWRLVGSAYVHGVMEVSLSWGLKGSVTDYVDRASIFGRSRKREGLKRREGGLRFGKLTRVYEEVGRSLRPDLNDPETELKCHRFFTVSTSSWIHRK